MGLKRYLRSKIVPLTSIGEGGQVSLGDRLVRHRSAVAVVGSSGIGQDDATDPGAVGAEAGTARLASTVADNDPARFWAHMTAAVLAEL